MGNNNFKKYLLYAIGEIVLVVIGILLALQINNWNEDRKDSKKEHIYLQGIYSDLKTNDEEFQRVINKTKRVGQAAITLLRLKDSLPTEWNTKVFDSLVLDCFGYTILMIDEGTINDLNGSGNLNLIKNDSIRETIASWNANLIMIREYENLSKEAVFKFRDICNNYINSYEAVFQKSDLLKTEERLEFYNNKYLNNSIFEIVQNALTLNRLYIEEQVKMQKFQNQIYSDLEHIKP